VPDIAAEIRSPSTWRYEIGAKKATYERAGLPELWLLDTAADEIFVFRRSSPRAPGFDVSLELGIADALTSPLLPGFALDPRTLFADWLLPNARAPAGRGSAPAARPRGAGARARSRR
jgi:Uma2 family endonuclease